MGFYFYDDSKHPQRGNFVVGAWVFSDDDPAPKVHAAIRRVGLTPGSDEFKSSAKMTARPEQASLREELHQIGGSLALVVCPYSQLPELGAEGMRALSCLVREAPGQGGRHQAYFDREIFGSVPAGEKALRKHGLEQQVEGHFEQDSRKVLGIQLADLAAHACSMMLLEQLGLIGKLVKAGENSGYDPESKIELGLELWARTRYRWAHGPAPEMPENGPIGREHMTLPVLGHGLFLSDACSERLRDAAQAR